MMKKTFGICIILLMTSIYSESVESRTTQLVAVDNAYPPYMHGKSKHVEGLYPLMIKTIFSHASIDVEVKGYPWKRALKLGERREAAIGGAYKNKQRLKMYDYTDAFYEEKLMIYVKKGHEFPFANLSDLQGKKVGINPGWSYGEEFDNARKNSLFRTYEAKDNLTNLKKLIQGKIDCVIADKLSAATVLLNANLKGHVVALPVPASQNKAYVIFSKSLNSTDNIKKFNLALNNMKEDGSYQILIDGFFKNGTHNQ